jgi:hypothetical protein
MSQRRNGAASGLSVYAYSPGRSKKKNPNRSISAIVFEAAVLARRHKAAVWARMGNGMGLTRVGGGSCFL